MAFVNDTMILVQSPTLVERFATFRAHLSEAVLRRKKYHQVLNELSGMTDRDLADIGIARRQITEIARKAVA